MSRYSYVLLLGTFAVCKISIAASLSYSKLAENEFELLLSNDSPLETSQVQSAIYQSAVQICSGRKPVYGKYKFDSQEPLAGNEGPKSYRFFQRIKCTDNFEKQPKAEIIALSEDQENQIKADAKKSTREFLSAKIKGQYELAYKMLTPGMQEISDFHTWQKRESEHFANAGTLTHRDIWRVTVYNNPENSPLPGIYIATDYEDKYENIPVHCGYVIWYIPDINSSEYRVMREEYGGISSEIMTEIPPTDLENVRKQIGCRAF